jgi:hypothetical protein
MAALDVVGLDARRRAATLMQFGTSAVFDPFTMSASSALRLMSAWRTEVVAGAGPAAWLPHGATPPAG